MAFDPLPQARVVRKGNQKMTPPRAPRTERSVMEPIVRGLSNGFQVAMGLWPLTAVVLLMIGFLIMAGNGSSHPYR